METDRSTDQTETAGAPADSTNERHASLTIFAADYRADVYATALNSAWQVKLSVGQYSSGQFSWYMTTAQARDLAAALVASADHYDAEGARLAQAGAL
ncbi:hypothetical protein [Lysobacter enzymogenes]|uniref:hypothetical protein n=1 Tax=Lysobacter enzymogenes TaxID=69 RepID=UPI000899E519|nr:hypothetical protein [Lysobacter enzymogenes]SDW94009.1 hypothetical protein SAMN05421681_103284 [Lysobacter enzymogenes]